MDENERIPALLIISGPTASGKSSMAEALALTCDYPIISADSRQIYRNFDIGTAKPTKNIQSQIRYEMIDILDPTERFSAGKFAERASHLIDHKYRHEKIIIIAGGTGFYIKALIDGLARIPNISPDIDRKWDRMWQENGIEYMQKKMEVIDPVFMQEGDPHNPHRLLRAVKIADQTGLSIYDFKPKTLLTRDHPIRSFALDLDRKVLYDRINSRVDDMLDRGLVEEVRSLLPYQNCPAMRSVGYKEIIPYFEDNTSLENAVDKIKQHSRNYAKRQLTWLRKHGNWTWIPPEDNQKVMEWANQYL